MKNIKSLIYDGDTSPGWIVHNKSFNKLSQKVYINLRKRIDDKLIHQIQYFDITSILQSQHRL